MNNAQSDCHSTSYALPAFILLGVEIFLLALWLV